MKLEILQDPSLPGHVNMEKDRLHFERVEGGEEVILLRLYTWEPRCLSLGALQDESGVNWDLVQRLGLDTVRRLTGGGAILHENELTYSWAAPRSFFPDVSVDAVLRWSTHVLTGFYQSLGLAALPASRLERDEPLGSRTTACYAGKEPWDLTIGGRKIGGNAQRRGRRAIFQHGSIPLLLDWELVCQLTHTPTDTERPLCLFEALRVLPPLIDLERLLEEAWRRAFES